MTKRKIEVIRDWAITRKQSKRKGVRTKIKMTQYVNGKALEAKYV